MDESASRAAHLALAPVAAPDATYVAAFALALAKFFFVLMVLVSTLTS